MPQISYSVAAFRDRGLEPALDAIAAAGFSHTELIAKAPHIEQPFTGAELTELRRSLESRGLTATTVHAPFSGSGNLGMPNDETRCKNVAVFAAYAEFTGAIDAAGLIVHVVPTVDAVVDSHAPGIGGAIRAAVRRSLDALAPVAARAGVRILLENTPRYESPYPLYTHAELRELIGDYPGERVGLIVDTGHSWTNGIDPAAEIATAGDRLWGTHLQDVDDERPCDQHWPPDEGGLDWAAILAALEKVNYRGAWTFEIAAGRNNETPEQLAQMTKRFAEGWIGNE